MEYNTQRSHLIIPEYGRNIQKMIEYAMSVEDREERNNVARAIVDVMGQLNPHLRDITDFKHKLWDHLFIISDFKLDVDSPYPKPSAQTLDIKPERVKYPNTRITFRHYGKNIENMIKDIRKMGDGPEREALVASVANFMKMSYLNHNRDTVSDELIIDHLNELSDGELKLKEDFRLNHTNEILSKSKKPVEKKTSRIPLSKSRSLNKKR
jgi:hypothetical protein